MTFATGWWIPVTFGLVVAALMLLWTLLQRSGTGSPAAPADPAKEALYLGYLQAAERLFAVPVWSRNSAEPAPPVDTLIDEIDAVAPRIAFYAPRPVTEAANDLAAQARSLAEVIIDIRVHTMRPTLGALEPVEQQRHDEARRAFGARVDAWTVLARHDMGITSEYLPGRLPIGADEQVAAQPEGQ